MTSQAYKEKFPAAFPTLTEEQLSIVKEFATCKTYKNGDVLFKAGETGFRFHVIKSGEIEIIDRTGHTPKTVLIHQSGEFTGDIANLAGRSSHVDAIAKGQVELYEIGADDLREIIAERPTLSDTILKAFIARGQGLIESNYTGLLVMGSQYSADTFRIRDFLAKNRVLFTWIDLESDPNVEALLKRFHIKENETPIVAYGNEWLLRNPTNLELANRIGIRKDLKEELVDLIIVGGGPAGLAAAVYGASEGLKTVVLEAFAPGGQAGSSSKIENYLGFPTGLSGSDLASRATIQAEKFGAQLSVPSKVSSLTFEGNYKSIHLETGETLSTKALVIACGADYKKLQVDGLQKFEGTGVYYAATQMEATSCKKEQVVIVGGGNSAGQAAIFLSANTQKVFLVIRGESLQLTMSRYLCQRIEDTPTIQLLTNSEITKAYGSDHLEAVDIIDNKTQETTRVPVAAIFSFIGAVPRTDWLPPEIEKDEKGFIKTGLQVASSALWKRSRQPYFLETSSEGVFAVGDVRSGSVKRVSSAVGEGSMAIQFVHEYLKFF